MNLGSHEHSRPGRGHEGLSFFSGSVTSPTFGQAHTLLHHPKPRSCRAMKAPTFATVPAPLSHMAPHADAEDAARPSTPPPTDFHTRCARMGPPEDKVDRSGRIRFPVPRVRPSSSGVHKHHQPGPFRALGPVHLSALLNPVASRLSPCHVVASLPAATSAFSVAGFSPSLSASPVWLEQGDAHRE